MKYILFIAMIMALASCKVGNNTASESNDTDDTEIVVSMGDWKEGYYKDEFGDNTDVRLVFQEVEGTHQYEDSDKGRATVYIIVDEDDILFRLKTLTYESDEDDVLFKIKDVSDNIFEFQMKANNYGYISATTSDQNEALRELLLNSTWLKVLAVINNYTGETSYNFTFNAEGLEDALMY